MRFTRSLFIISLLLLDITAFGQLRIAKRKHLSGFQIEVFRSKKASVLSTQNAEDVGNKSETEETPNVIYQIARSGDNISSVSTIQDILVNNSELDQVFPISERLSKLNNFAIISVKLGDKSESRSFIPVGAGWIKKASIQNEPKAKSAVFDFFAISSFVLGCIAVLGFPCALIPGFGYAAQMVLCAIPAMFFGLVGLFGNKPKLADLGIRLGGYSLLAVLAIFVGFIIYMAAFG